MTRTVTTLPHDDRGSEVITLLIFMTIVPTTAIALRIWSRALIPTTKSSRSRRFWWDDWLVMLDLPFCLATSSLDLYWTTFGLGKHVYDVTSPDRSKGLLVLWAQYYLYMIAIWLTKLSALACYARLFSLNNRIFRIVLKIVTALSCAWIIVPLVSTPLQCRPVQKAWKPEIDGECINVYEWWLANAISSLILDFVILVLPLPILWRLQIKLIRKLLICGVFLCGYLVIVVSIGRVVTIAQAGQDFEKFIEDFTWNVVPVGMWLAVESPISILSLCLPSIFSLIKRGIDGGPRALFPTQLFPIAENVTDRFTILNQNSGGPAGILELYELPFDGNDSKRNGKRGETRTECHAAPLRNALSSQGSYQNKNTGSQEDFIHIQTEVEVKMEFGMMDDV